MELECGQQTIDCCQLAQILADSLADDGLSKNEKLSHLTQLLARPGTASRHLLLAQLKEPLIEALQRERHPIQDHPQLISIIFSTPSVDQNFQQLARTLRSTSKRSKLAGLSFFLQANLTGVSSVESLIEKEELHQLEQNKTGLLLSLVQDENYQVRVSALRAILRLRGLAPLSSLKPVVYFMVNDQYREVRLEALTVLRRLTSNLILDDLQLELLYMTIRDTDQQLRLSVYCLLQVLKLSQPKSLLVLVDRLAQTVRLFPRDARFIFIKLKVFALRNSTLILSARHLVSQGLDSESWRYPSGIIKLVVLGQLKEQTSVVSSNVKLLKDTLPELFDSNQTNHEYKVVQRLKQKVKAQGCERGLEQFLLSELKQYPLYFNDSKNLVQFLGVFQHLRKLFVVLQCPLGFQNRRAQHYLKQLKPVLDYKSKRNEIAQKLQQLQVVLGTLQTIVTPSAKVGLRGRSLGLTSKIARLRKEDRPDQLLQFLKLKFHQVRSAVLEFVLASEPEAVLQLIAC